MIEHNLSVTDQKAEMRKFTLRQRAAIFEKDAGFAARALGEFSDVLGGEISGVAVSGYVAIGNELDCMGLLQRLHARGAKIGLPLVIARETPLRFLQFSPGDKLVKGDFNVLTPEHHVQQIVPSILLVPLLAYDRTGYRLGYGGGFYDRTLKLLRSRGMVNAIGVAYKDQEVDIVPRDKFDQPLDGVLCEYGLIDF